MAIGALRLPDRRVLVVDDDPSILATISEVLELEGYSVETAANGADALRAVDRSEPAVVLLDMRMPVLDGWGFAREMRKRGKEGKIVVMTAAENARSWAREIQADDYLAKPFDLSDLIAKVERASRDG